MIVCKTPSMTLVETHNHAHLLLLQKKRVNPVNNVTNLISLSLLFPNERKNDSFARKKMSFSPR